MKKKTVPYSLRLPCKTMDWLNSSAIKNQRSVSSEIIFKLKANLNQEFSEQDVALFKKTSPTKNNDEVFQFRLGESLKESLRLYGKMHSNSLNQELVMRLFFAMQDKTAVPHGVQEGKTADFEEVALMTLYKKLSPAHKKAVMNLIKNLSG